MAKPWVYFFIAVPIPVNTVHCTFKGMVLLQLLMGFNTYSENIYFNWTKTSLVIFKNYITTGLDHARQVSCSPVQSDNWLWTELHWSKLM
jgi:hypothetical protein